MSTETTHIAHQIASLAWRDRLILLWQILQSFFPFSNRLTGSRSVSQQSSNTHRANLTKALSELQQICTEENYTLDVPSRFNRTNPFSDD
ncbi:MULTISPECIES: hypothetical protein [unclassified Coleofasciculus]|uniref:hypothetical protein n=1 Tax=unclassified Coleofasciculus TaxID=2692782 RepID=UPI0018824E2D|nr:MULTISPECIES: hypothetical protein [unclassified Coleofasciculus]MBE9126934.1 hypothetical protein [Coleofasciculus sp. LEGE 07081]MBE9148655.1 hypothetical protein [Coleofasciculus sp. LEGE 07092]